MPIIVTTAATRFCFQRRSLAKIIAPVTAGLLASAFYWQMPFLIFGVPSEAESTCFTRK